MGIETQRFVRKPLYVDAVQVTEENIFHVSMWCQGEIIWKRNPNGKGDAGEVDYIRVRVHSPQSERQKQAHVGDWVLYANRGYKVYTNKAFEKSFNPEPKTELKIAWEQFKRSIDNLKNDLSELGEEATEKKHFRGGNVEDKPRGGPQHFAVCDTCGAPKGTHAIGEMCNNNCGGRIIANPALESQAP